MIHDALRPRGFPGCVAYDCFGAGQAATATLGHDGDWRRGPAAASHMFAVFAALRDLHELMWHLHQAANLAATEELRGAIATAITTTRTLASAAPDALLAADLMGHRERTTDLLRRVSRDVRGEVVPSDIGARDDDLIGVDLTGRDLSGSSFRGARLVGATLRNCRLTRTDLTGADLRGADIRGADLSEAIFLTQSQLESANGDDRTQIPATLTRPAHWPDGT